MTSEKLAVIGNYLGNKLKEVLFFKPATAKYATQNTHNRTHRSLIFDTSTLDCSYFTCFQISFLLLYMIYIWYIYRYMYISTDTYIQCISLSSIRWYISIVSNMNIYVYVMNILCIAHTTLWCVIYSNITFVSIHNVSMIRNTMNLAI